MTVKIRTYLKNLLAILIGLLFAMMIGEVILRLLPNNYSVRGNKIVLQANFKYVMQTDNPKLDSVITHTKNSLGFRGPEKPENFDEYLSIVTVGGSTTACGVLSDGSDWPSILQRNLSQQYDKVWVNNAGFDGHSTFGHYVLLTDYLVHLKPKYAFYLIGTNDMFRDDITRFDRKMILNESNSFSDWIYKTSDLISFIKNSYRQYMARNLSHLFLDLNGMDHRIVDTVQVQSILKDQAQYHIAYKQRIKDLVNESRSLGIEPVLITQPLLFGEGIDPETGVNLETVEIREFTGYELWKIYESYNDQVRKAGMEENVHVIDLARKMPKNFYYFYDEMHFTREGSVVVGDILAQDFLNFYKKNRVQ